MFENRIFSLATIAFMSMANLNLSYATTLDDVNDRGFVNCGVGSGTLPGFASLSDDNSWSGLDADTCRMVAAAVFGDATKVKFISQSYKDRFTALQTGLVDILAHTATWTLTRDTKLNLDYAAINFYNGQGFLVKSSLGVSNALELSGATICTGGGTTSELNITDYFAGNNLDFKIVVFDRLTEIVTALFSGRCDAVSSDRALLAAVRTQAKNPDDYTIMPDIISKEPLGPLVRHGDNQWKDIVSWSFYASLEAEELGLSSKNIDEKTAKTDNPIIKRFIGQEGSFGESLGVEPDFAYQIIKQVGNYGEIYERSMGLNTIMKLPRGMNRLWSDGGLHYAPPMR